MFRIWQHSHSRRRNAAKKRWPAERKRQTWVESTTAIAEWN